MRYKRKNPASCQCRNNPRYFAVSFPVGEKERIKLAKWIHKNTMDHVRGQGWYSPKNQELVLFYRSPNTRLDAIFAVADAYGIQGHARSDLVPMERVRAKAPSVTPRQAQAAAMKLGWSRAEKIVGGSLSGASMESLVQLVREAERVRENPDNRSISEKKARQWVKQTLDIDTSAPYPGRIGPAKKAHLGWAFHVTFRNAKWGKQKGFGPEYDRWYLVGVDKDGHEFLQLTRPESIFGLQDGSRR